MDKKTLGRCLIKPWGVLSFDTDEFSFGAYVWIFCKIDGSATANMKIKIRITKRNEKSRLIKMWKNHLENNGNSKIAIQILGTQKEKLTFASVWPDKIEEKYLWLIVGFNDFGEVYRID